MSLDEGALPSLALDHSFGSVAVAPSLTVIVVSWRLDGRLERCLAALAASAGPDCEVIVVGNGVDPSSHVSILASAGLAGVVLGLADNQGPSPARNIAAVRAAGPLLLFLDDDAIPEPGWVEAHRSAHAASGVQGVRGRVVADRRPFLTRLARAYDLGDVVRPAVLNTEGNASIKREALLAVGGFASMFGHEGVELTGRLVDRYGTNSIRYDPAAVVRHDYVASFGGYLLKRFRHGRMLRRLGTRSVRMAASVRPPRTPWDVVMAPLRLVGAAAELSGLLWPAGQGA